MGRYGIATCSQALAAASTTGARCVVCNYPCTHKNYGVQSCGACCAFFRRTIKDARSYVCLRGKRCRIDYENPKRSCAYCRFRRCVTSGMSIQQAVERMPSTGGGDDYRRCLIDSFNSTFVNRFHAKLQKGTVIPQIHVEGSLKNTMEAMLAEFDVILKYLRQTGISEFLNGEQELVGPTRNPLAVSVVLHPIRLDHSSERRPSTELDLLRDESSVEINFDSEHSYVQRNGEGLKLRDPQIVARSLLSLHVNGMKTIVKYSLYDMEAEDFAFICHIFALYAASQMRPNKADIQQQLDRTFRTVQKHYEETYKNTALRLGNLVLSLNEANEFVKQFEEWVVLLTLNGCASILQKLAV
ncbi:hypothetical protein M3Y99_00901300 [Aphelenchoides fujianensis]|nr:hypothetical protein M3Y99_00901300 [Aphelenchoides fujianensis]